MIKKLGFIAECSKMDVKSAFRLLPMYQGEFDLLGFKIGNWYFIDKCLRTHGLFGSGLFKTDFKFLDS
jgi:hypothetical protein